MVIGGKVPHDAYGVDTVELLSFNGTLPDKVKRPNKFPVKIQQALGATLGDAFVPHVCGGSQGGRDEQKCWAYDPKRDAWNISGQMIHARSLNAGATHPDHGWVITGGYGGPDSAEQTKDGKTFQNFTSLPFDIKSHCMVSLGKGGGRGDFSITVDNYMLIHKAGTWKQMANMPTARKRKSY